MTQAIGISAGLYEKKPNPEVTKALANSHNNRGICFSEKGQFNESIADFGRSIALCTQLITQKGYLKATDELGLSYHNRAIAHRRLGNLPEAAKDFDNAIRVFDLLAKAGQKIGLPLARSHYYRAVVLDGLGRPSEAIQDFSKAIEVYSHLDERHASAETAGQLAMAHHNRGVILRNQGKLVEAVEDLGHAVEIYANLNQGDEDAETARAHHDRGIAHFQLNKFPEAIQDYDKAVQIYTRLVKQEGHKELTIDLAHTLNNESWLYVSSSNSEFRDAVKGKQNATRACELTDWKESGLLDTLAAACAASGDFDAAVKWQLKSIDLAPDEQKAELRERLERYRAKEGNPPT